MGLSVTSVPSMNRALHDVFLGGQESPLGQLSIEPSLFFLIVRLNLGSFLNTALMPVFLVRVRLQVFPSGSGTCRAANKFQLQWHRHPVPETSRDEQYLQDHLLEGFC